MTDLGKRFRADCDDFTGTCIGSYTTREGRDGLVLQMDNARVVHVYGRNRLTEIEAQPAGEWMPIDTAPKDGSRFDAWSVNKERHADVKWSARKNCFLEWAVGDFDTCEWVRVQYSLTHWMPVPQPPASTEG
ncbi:hypothetical protein [Roseicella sp. DB1501]|uniref:hypothetical protein n=1 Tax=Roseicella sp. DB1501 TaxID=2730925 RepID=UPI001492E1A2|nr:hypothetical protein [Roseicella sp. DB1501]NOG70495.1 hypothetical protein [Roseicella sp. DB1501]